MRNRLILPLPLLAALLGAAPAPKPAKCAVAVCRCKSFGGSLADRAAAVRARGGAVVLATVEAVDTLTVRRRDVSGEVVGDAGIPVTLTVARLRVARSWTPLTTDTLTVGIGLADGRATDCDLHFVPGRAYLVFADPVAGEPVLRAGHCGGTQSADGPMTALGTLGPGLAPPASGRGGPGAAGAARLGGRAADGSWVDARGSSDRGTPGLAGDSSMVVPRIITGPVTAPPNEGALPAPTRSPASTADSGEALAVAHEITAAHRSKAPRLSDATRRRSTTTRDGRIYVAALALAEDPGAAPRARVEAMAVLVRQYLGKGDYLPVDRAMTATNEAGCDLEAVIPFGMAAGPAPVPPDAGARLQTVAQRLFADSAAPTSVRAGAFCLQLAAQAKPRPHGQESRARHR
ncbi:hypothetical protein [Roseisolibacter agri]|nr:hypothetical protein [Roseisolibacter agri]